MIRTMRKGPTHTNNWMTHNCIIVLRCFHKLSSLHRSAIQPRRKERSSAQYHTVTSPCYHTVTTPHHQLVMFDPIIVSHYHHSMIWPSHEIIETSCLRIIISSCEPIIISSRHQSIMPAYHHLTLSSQHHFLMS